MLDTAKPQLNKNIFTKQQKSLKDGKNPRYVWQDKDAIARVRVASPQPVTVGTSPRTRRKSALQARSRTPVRRRRLVQVAAWVDEPIRAQLAEIARSEGLSVSQTIAALLKDKLRERLHKQHAALLPEIIEQAVVRSNRRLATRLAWLLMRIAFDTGQTRVLATNILGFQEEMNEAHLKEILQTADKRTKANLTRRTPQLTELMHSVEEWLLEGEEEKRTNGSG